MKRFIFEDFTKLVKNPVGGGVTDAIPLDIGEIFNALVVVTCVALPKGLGEVLNVLVEVTCGVGQGLAVFRHAEFISASHHVSVILNMSLRGAERRGNPLKISPLPLGEGRILNELASCKNSGEGVMHGTESTIFTDVDKIFNSSLRRSRRRLKQSSLCINRSRNTCAMTDNLSLRSGFCNIFILPSFLRNQNKTPLLSLRDTLSLGERTKLYPLSRGEGTGFTLAETLITLGIIGVVAAIVMPNVINYFKVKQLEAQFKRADNIVTQAFQRSILELGYTSATEFTLSGVSSEVTYSPAEK